MTKFFVKFHSLASGARNSSDEGAAAAEYGILLAALAVAVGGAAVALGGRITTLFNSILP
jgi:pilus assembly protein Flp/PilA